MSQSYENGVVNRTRLEEAYRLFSLDQDVHYEREVQRGSLMEWAQATFFQLLDPDEIPALARLAQAPFGLWIRHRAGVMFEHSRELAAISERAAGDRRDIPSSSGGRGDQRHTPFAQNPTVCGQ
jgi:diguanylate cyclase